MDLLHTGVSLEGDAETHKAFTGDAQFQGSNANQLQIHTKSIKLV